MAVRDGKRRPRESMQVRRKEQLGYYLIATDAQETEVNYLNGLKAALPDEIKKKITIKILDHVKVDHLIDTVLAQTSQLPQYAEPWIVLDRDKVPEFDKLIQTAEAKGISVGWSNPCIEIWFWAYYGSMPTFSTSVQCVRSFKTKFQSMTGMEYAKSEKDIYKKLASTGDEDRACKIARQRYQSEEQAHEKPSEMISATNLFRLICEIRSKTR